MARTFTKNEKHRPVVTIKKVKKNIPTVLEVSGKKYILDRSEPLERARKVNIESESNKYF